MKQPYLNRTVSKIPIIFFAVHFRCIQYEDFVPFFSRQRKQSLFRQNPIVVKWSTISFISFLSFPLIFDPAYECKCMSSSTLLNILYYKVTLLEKYNLKFPIGNSRVLHIGISWWKAWIESVQDFLIKLDIKSCKHLVKMSIFH